MLGRHLLPGEQMKRLMREVVVTPAFRLIPIDEYRIQARKLACRTGDARRRVHVQTQRAEPLPDSLCEQQCGNLAEIPFSAERFRSSACLLERASLCQWQASLKRAGGPIFSLAKVSIRCDPPSRARLEFVQQSRRGALRAPREAAFSYQAKAVGEVFEIHTEHLHCSYQFLSRELALPCFNRRKGLTVLEAELLRKLSLRKASSVARGFESSCNEFAHKASTRHAIGFSANTFVTKHPSEPKNSLGLFYQSPSRTEH